MSTSAGVADGATEDIWNNIRLDCSKQRRSVAQHSHTVGVLKPGGGMNTWKRLLLPSGKLSRPGRLAKALGHHTMQPKEMPDMQCTMLMKKLTWENCLEEVQGSATSSLFTSPLFQNTLPCVQLLCAECNAPCQRDLAVDKVKPSTYAAK